MKVTAPAQITKVSTMADGSIKLEAVTQELPHNEMATLFELRKAQGWFLFAENEIQEADLPKEQAEVGEKTPSQRLRGVLHVLWEQQGRKGTFEAFYRASMEKLVNQVKEKLE